MDAKAERSKFIQGQKQKVQELEKKIKKLKGAMKEAAQKELEELESQQEAELAAFEGVPGSSADGSADKAKGAEPEMSLKELSKFKDRGNWNGLSKKELEDDCTERGLGKKGGKEDLIQRLIMFHQDLQLKLKEAAANGEAPVADEKDDDDEDEEEDDEDDDDDEEEEEDDMPEVDDEELEKQAKREKAIQKAVKFLLTDKCSDGFPLSELVQKLEMVNVKGFAPEKLGYKSVEKFVRGQPENVLRYRRKEQMVLPPRK